MNTNSPRPARENTLKRKLREGQTCLGVVMRVASETLVEMAAAAGCDHCIVDLEHEPLNLGDAAAMIRVADLCGMTPIARVGRFWRHQVDPLLAAGAQGFTLARVRTPADIEELAQAIYYWPLGVRTVYALGRSGHFGLGGLDEAVWGRESNNEFLITAIIEEADSIDNIEAILAHPRLDAVEGGAKDLRASLGMVPLSEARAKIEEVFDRAAAKGLAISHSVLGHTLLPQTVSASSRGTGTMLNVSASAVVLSVLTAMRQSVSEAVA